MNFELGWCFPRREPFQLRSAEPPACCDRRQKALHDHIAQIDNDVNGLMQLSKAVDSIHERTAQLGRTVDDRLVDLEVKSKAKDDELGGKVRWPLMLSTLSSTRAE